MDEQADTDDARDYIISDDLLEANCPEEGRVKIKIQFLARNKTSHDSTHAHELLFFSVNHKQDSNHYQQGPRI